MERHIEVIARGFILREENILLCKAKEKKHWYFPGGHVELGENSKMALKREMAEEIGEEIQIGQFMGINENKFSDAEGEHQELNIIFEARLDKEAVSSQEEHLEFCWMNRKEFSSAFILPENMKKSVLEWMEDREVFHSEQ